MYCWNCGKEMDDDLLFCPHCAMKQAVVPEPKPKKRIPVLPIVCALVCVAVLLTMIFLLAFSGHRALEEPVDPYSVELPDLAAFLNTQYTWDDVSAYTHYVTCQLKKEEGLEGAGEFVELLQKKKYQLKLDETRSETEDKADRTDYIFHYTGRGEGIDWVPHKEGYRYHVKLSVYSYFGKDQVTMTLYTAPGFQLADPGVDAKIAQ